MKENGNEFSKNALSELLVLRELLDRILDYTNEAFRKQNLMAARHIEPLEEVVDDMVNALKENHIERLRGGECGVVNGTEFFNLLSEAERISDVCSNVGVATVARATPEIKHQVHDYVTMLHSGRDEEFNRDYQEAHDRYFRLLEN
ncbi:PhoU domain-containing protein [Bariatricus sp. SGI.154]|uniref:PhoU domain-containing protein n=1 Tax=Bariatricus sp. SGI.154 TaxID=3420549 RepID=UPI003D00CB77